MKDPNNNRNNGRTFSFFSSPITNTKPSRDFTLLDAYDYVVGHQASHSTYTLRSITDKNYAKQYKASNFYYCTFSGTFTRRDDSALIQHSGLLCIDLDHLYNIEQVRQILLNDEYFETQLLFVSPSGDGLKWIVEIDIEEATHKEWFNAISNYLMYTYSLQVDKSGKDISRACFLPHDPSCYINNKYPRRNYQKFDVKKWLNGEQKEYKSERQYLQNHCNNIEDDIEMITKEIEDKSVDITSGYDNWCNIGFALVDALGENGRDYFHRLSRFYPNYSYEEADKQYTRCLNANGHGITYKTLFFIAKEAGITITPITPITQIKNNPKTSITSTDVSDVSDEENKHIFEKMPNFYSLVKDNLPDFLKKIADTTITDEDADIMILGSIITISSSLPNIYGIYAGREVFPNLFLFVTAQASAGKGKLSLCRKLVEPIHRQLREEYDMEMEKYRQQLTEYTINKKESGAIPPKEPPRKMLFIPANSSSTAVYQALNENKGIGLIFETEGDTLANTFKSDYGNFSDGFRKAFQHEPISYLRRKDRELVELDKPRLSALLSGTPRQVLSLIPDAENGLFSRFIFYYLPLRPEWIDVSAIKEPLDKQFETLGKEFDILNKYLKNSHLPIRFDFTASQFKNFNALFEQIQYEYYCVFGSDIISAIRRLGIITFRIAMILSTLRVLENGLSSNVIICSDTDYTTAITMIKVLLKHTTKVFQMLPENNNAVLQGSKNQLKQQFFDALPHNFDTQSAISVAKSLNIPKPTAERYLKQWTLSAQINRVKHGCYSKA